MQDYHVKLESPVSNSFRCQKAANSLDIDVEKKSAHEFSVHADLDSPFNVGLIVGASGSGKTTLAEQIWGKDVFEEKLDLGQPVIDQFPDSMSYEDCQKSLSGMGLTSVPCWIRPAHTLSNGQRARAEAALQMVEVDQDGISVIDEWTSVVDRTVAKAMSHCIQKHARKNERRVVLLSCHYDVIEWLDPDWIIDCNKQEFVDRRSLRPERTERLQFDIRECGRKSWRYFSKYHYLSDKLPGGLTFHFGLYHGADQIGYLNFANYVAKRHGQQTILHSNRLVVHPDYTGFGLSGIFMDHASAVMARRGYAIKTRFSSQPVKRLLDANVCWRQTKKEVPTKISVGGTLQRRGGFRTDVAIYNYDFLLKRYEQHYESNTG